MKINLNIFFLVSSISFIFSQVFQHNDQASSSASHYYNRYTQQSNVSNQTNNSTTSNIDTNSINPTIIIPSNSSLPPSSIDETNISSYDQMVNYCNSLNETFNPKVIDCTSININCCYANYTITQYSFSTCFYNEKKDNTNADSFFQDSIGSISSSPLMTYSVKCNTRFLYISYSILYFMFLIVCGIFP